MTLVRSLLVSTMPCPTDRPRPRPAVLPALLALLAACAQAPPPAPSTSLAGRGAPATAQEPATAETVARFGIGFTDGPDSFLLGAQVDFYQDERFALGPMLQLGLADDVTLVAPSVLGKYRWPLRGAAEGLAPFAQAGVGLLWLERDGRRRDDDDVGFLLQAGGGIEWRVDERMSLASTILVDLLPADVLDEHAIFTWQVAQIGFRF